MNQLVMQPTNFFAQLPVLRANGLGQDARGLSDEYFLRMMLPVAETNAEPYTTEEQKIFLDLLARDPAAKRKNFIVVGAGTLWHIESVLDKVSTYVAVEARADLFIPKQIRFLIGRQPNVRIIGEEFGAFNPEQIPTGNSYFVFHFNIISYLPNICEALNRYLKAGDIAFFSTWSRTARSLAVRRQYFDYLNSHAQPGEFTVDPSTTDALTDLQLFPVDHLRHYVRHESTHGEIVSSLTIFA